VVLQHLMAYPMVRHQGEAGTLTLHDWHYVIEAGEIHIFDARKGDFVPASQALEAVSALCGARWTGDCGLSGCQTVSWSYTFSTFFLTLENSVISRVTNSM